MNKFFTWFLRHRSFVLLLTVLALLASGYGMTKMDINSDISSYLPEDSTSKKTMHFLSDNFDVHGDAVVCIQAPLAAYDEMKTLAADITRLDNVASVNWLGSYDAMLDLKDQSIASAYPILSDASVQSLCDSFYREADGVGYYVFLLSLRVPNSGNEASKAMDQVKELLVAFDHEFYMGGNAMQSKNMLDSALSDLPKFLTLAVVVIFIILLLTNKSVMSAIIFLMTIGISILLNMGTNVFTDSISTVTFSVAAILQLALSMDYSIFLTHAYEKMRKTTADDEQALAEALKKTCVVILASALTTIAGFCALFAMRFELGFDLGLCLAKGVTISFFTVLFVQPCLMLLFRKACEKTTHRTLTPKFDHLAKLPEKLKYWAIVAVVVIAVPAIFFSSTLTYYYLESNFDEQATGAQKIVQDMGSQLVFVTEKGTVEQQIALLDRLHEEKKVQSISGYYALVDAIAAGISFPIQDGDGNVISTITFTTPELLDLLETGTVSATMQEGILATLTKQINDTSPARIKQAITQKGLLSGHMLTPAEQKKISDDVVAEMTQEMMNDLTSQMGGYQDMLSGFSTQLNEQKESFFAEKDGKEYTYFLLMISGSPESKETTQTVTRVQSLIADVLPGTTVQSVGNSQVVLDLEQTTQIDFLLVSVLSAALILLILCITFRGIFIPILLVALIELAIQCNLALCTIGGENVNFMSYIIISAIQMGATIDYAILYVENYKKSNVAEAIRSSAFPILISMSILVCACLSVYFLSTDAIIREITLLIARGSAISAFVVLVILPALLSIRRRKAVS